MKNSESIEGILDSKKTLKPIAGAQELVFRYRTFQLGELNFKIERGDRIALIGANGSGKTTLLNLLAGLKKESSGSLKLNVPKEKIALLGEHVQFPAHWPLATCVQSYFDLKKVDLRVSLSNLLGSSEKERIWRRTSFSEGSKGMKVQALLKAIQFQMPTFLICDEPSSGLDPSYQQELLRFLNAYPGTLIMSTHYFSEMQKLNWTHTWLLKNGKMQEIITPKSPMEWERAFELV